MRRLLKFRFLPLAIAMVFVAVPAHADAPRTLSWDDLIPEGATLESPYKNLDLDQQVELEMLTSIRGQLAAGVINEVHPLFEDAREIEFKLKGEGIDVEAMIPKVREFQAEIVRRNTLLAHTLDGETVRLPGYVLPLEFDGTSVEEFLLVPYVGACIHVPPPPINQTVIVHLKQSFRAKELYEPVWVTGKLTVKRATRALTLVDGTGDVTAGYSIQGTLVEPYKDKSGN